MTEKQREDRARRRLRAQGLTVRKDRVRTWNCDHYGGYMVINAYTNYVEGGQRFDLTLEDLEQWAEAE